MAMMLFTALNGMGVGFLVYVLAQFWKEGHRSEQPDARERLIEFSVKDKPTVVVVTRPISGGLQVEPAPVSLSARGGLSVLSRQARMGGLVDSQIHRDSADNAAEMPVKRYSSR
jgi:hypothetical protein